MDLAAKGRPEREAKKTMFSCENCKKEFGFAPGQLRSYRKQWSQDPKYCSRECSYVGRRMKPEEFSDKGRRCLSCDKPLPVVYRNGTNYLDLRRKVCDKKCRDELHAKVMLEAHADREIVARPARHGYVRVSIRRDPSKKAIEILEHRYNMERAIGRPLRTGETVHHINGDKTDNRIENLELFESRHGPGQRVVDKIDWCVAFLTDYPEQLRTKGYKLVKTQALTPCL